jgi:hypothetical protein
MPDFISEHWRLFLGIAVMPLVWWRFSQRPITLNLSDRTAVDAWEPPLLSEALPAFADEIRNLLIEQGEQNLAPKYPHCELLANAIAEMISAGLSTFAPNRREPTVPITAACR